jgi:DNA-binding NtrC family response regulator
MASKTILIVDDDSSIVSMLSFAFKNKGYEILEASNGDEAKKLINGQQTDIIITDALMPRKDGFTFLKELRSTDEYKNIPIIIISGVYKTFSIIQSTINELGASDYFTKPFNLEKLVKKVQKLCPVSDEKDEDIAVSKNASKYLFTNTIPDNSEFKIIPIYKVIANLFSKNRTGLLTVNDQSVVKKIFIKGGVPIEVSSNIASEWLGRILVRENVGDQYIQLG